MKEGKRKCEILKKIRKEIAEQNGIDLHQEECEHKGNCPGTCPVCEAELAELGRIIKEKKARGEDVSLRIEDRDILDVDMPEMGMPAKPLTDRLVPKKRLPLVGRIKISPGRTAGLMDKRN